MGWFFKKAKKNLHNDMTTAVNRWFHSFWAPSPHVIRTRVEVDLYVCGSARAALEQFKAINGD